MTLRVVELFAGIGAQRMALTLAGIPHEVVAISEIDKHALASYAAIWGDCPNLGDIREIKALPPCDLVTYSFPCQDLSLAGKRKGMAEGAGTRSGLVWEVVRLLEGGEEKPEWLLMENVPQVLTAAEWPALVGRLEAMGYRSRWAKLDSSKFGSAQKRVRAFMVSRLNANPPELPECTPGAPMLCLRDVMETNRDERYVRRIPLDRIKWRAPKEGYRHPQSEGLDCPLMDISDPRLETRRIAAEDSLCPTIRRGCPQKTVEEEEEARVKSLVDMAENLRNAPKGCKAIGTMTSDGERLQIAPSDGGHIDVFAYSTPCARIDGETFYSKAMLYSPSLLSPTIRTEHGKNSQIKVIEDESELKVIGEDMSEGQWKPHRYILDPEGPSRCVGAYANAAQRGIKVVADWDRAGRLDLANRLYSADGAAPTMVGMGGGNRDVKVIADDSGESYDRMARIYGDKGKSPTIDQLGRRGSQMIKIAEGTEERELRVNILMPRECWRLMGFPEWAFIRASRVSSETQLYNQAGNSIVVEVLMAIFRAMFPSAPARRQATLEEACA